MVAERLAKHLWLVIIAPIVVGIVSALTTAMVTGDFRPWESRATLTRTELRLYTAGTVFGLPAGMKITGTAKGVCNEDSNVLRVPEAHRCSGGKYIYDPCLEAGTPDFSLVCVDAPWENKAIRFRPTAFYYLLRGKKYGKYGKYVKVPANNPSPAPPPTLEPTLAQVTSKPPWALELTNGAKCVFVSGATFAVADQRANYECSHGWAIGVPARTDAVWTASFYNGRASSVIAVPVRVAWF